MPGNEADRIASEMVRREKAQKEADEREARRQAEDYKRALVKEVEEQIPIVLRLLAERGYPDIEPVHYLEWNTPGLFAFLFLGRRNEGIKGGWKVGKYTYTYIDSVVTDSIYLLSDGRIGTGRSGSVIVRTPRETATLYSANEILNPFLAGLENLRQRLEQP